MKTKLFKTLCIIAAFTALKVDASTIFQFSGTIDQIEINNTGSPPPALEGDTFTGTITLGEGRSSVLSHDLYAIKPFEASINFSNNFEGKNLDNSVSLIAVNNSSSEDLPAGSDAILIPIFLQIYTTPDYPFMGQVFTISLIDTDGTALDFLDFSYPPPPAQFSEILALIDSSLFETTTLTWEIYEPPGEDDDGKMLLHGSITHIEEVPLPASTWLLGSALLGLVGAKRRWR